MRTATPTKTAPPKTIPAWSISRVHDFEKCKLMVKLKVIDKIPEPERPLPAGKTEHANDRGTRIHTGAELFVQSKGPFITELKDFKAEFNKLQELFKAGKVSLEGEWGFDKDWQPCDWKAKECWARIKLDALVHLSNVEGVVIDYKSGRKAGNEIKHAEQMQLYIVASFLRYPQLQTITAELWYVDQNELSSMTMTRMQAMRFLKNFTQRGQKMTTCTDFPPSANMFSCKWCPYKGNACPHGV